MPGFILGPPPVEVPDDLEYLLIWHGDIRSRASYGMHFEPIALAEIGWYEHFLAKADIRMTAFDWEMIFRIDEAWKAAVPKPETPAGR